MNDVARARAASRAMQFQFQIRTMTTHFQCDSRDPSPPAVDASTPDLGGAPASRSIDRSSPSVERARTDARDSFARRFDSIDRIASDRSIGVVGARRW